MQMILIRHGESIWNRSQRFTGWADAGLTPHGVRQMRQAARQLIGRGVHVGACFTSTLQRSIEAAHALLDCLPEGPLLLQPDWRLNERHYGALTGLNKQDAVRDHGAEQVRRWRRSFEVAPPPLTTLDALGDVPLWADSGISTPSGESLRDVVERVEAVWHERLRPALHPTTATLVVAHGNSLRALRMMVERLDSQAIVGCEVDNASPIVYTFDRHLGLQRVECVPAFEPTPSHIL